MADIAAEYRHGERIASLEKEREHLATRAELYKALLVQAGVILAGVALIVKFVG